MAPSTHETQLSDKSLVGTDLAHSAEVNTIADLSIEGDTPDADNYLSADEGIGMNSLNMDGNYSEDHNPDADENSSEDDIDADDLGPDENSSTDEGSSADNTLDPNTNHKVSKRYRRILGDIEKVRQGVAAEKSKREAEDQAEYHQILDDIEEVCEGVLKADAAAKILKREAEEQDDVFAKETKRIKTNYERDLEKLNRKCGTLKNKCDALEDDNKRAWCEVRRTVDRDLINKANEGLRLDLDEKKAELRKERNEKADYHRIKEERTDFHRKLIEKTNNCNDLEKKNTELQSELIEKTKNCTGLEKEVAALQRKLDEEVSSSAQAMAMFSKKPEI